MDQSPASTPVRPRYIVSGANGFIGARLVGHLRRDGEVLGVDLYWGPSPRVPEPRTTIDLTQPIPDAPELHGATVIHAAGPGEGADRQALWEGNVDVAYNVLDWALRHEARQVVLLSCAEVYPVRPGHRHRETDPVAAATFAGHTKILAEQLAGGFQRLYGLPVTVIRAFFPFGPGQTGGCIARVRRALAEGVPVPAPAAGRCRINPVHVDDLVEAVALAAAGAPAGLRVFNVCGDQLVGFADLVERLAGGPGPGIEAPPAPAGDLLGDNTLARRTLGWRPQRDLDALNAPVPEDS